MPDTPKEKILIVDDSSEDLRIALEFLKEDYAVTAATSGEMAVKMATADEPPTVILMDVNMPQMSGYEACEQIKKHNDDISIIFVSGNESTEEILQGYSAGGMDYVVKPFSPAVLSHKIQHALKIHNERTHLHEAKDKANEIAMTALCSSGELSVVLNFLRESVAIDNLQSLAHGLIDATKEYGLESSIQIRCHQNDINLSDSGEVSPVELELLNRIKETYERFFQFGKRLFINYKDITLLIKNMPTDDTREGRLKDYLMTLIECASLKKERLESIKRNTENVSKELIELVKDTELTLQFFRTANKEQKEKSVEIMDNMKREFEGVMSELHLTENQENKILNIYNQAIDDFLSVFEDSLKTDAQLKRILVKLAQLKNK
ncbi:response regulator [Pleionea sp. CnH1-48]|uniref:response regulator n=1 Tax=Pleionea sp. CnH1-48 TaxID=2954494 RepID=UPI002096E38A|nr:response regulator [Pleionea sp. CnH1-48]MCO7222934.1 response regulator [Pleionea sp. CnH1-48]